MQRRVVIRPFSAQSRTGSLYQFQLRDLLYDCTPSPDGEQVAVYAGTGEARRERFKVDRQTLLDCTQRV